MWQRNNFKHTQSSIESYRPNNIIFEDFSNFTNTIFKSKNSLQPIKPKIKTKYLINFYFKIGSLRNKFLNNLSDSPKNKI